MVAIAALAFMSSCQQGEVAPSDSVSAEVKAKLVNASFDVTDIQNVDRVNKLSGEREVGYMLEGDMFIPMDRLDEIANAALNADPSVEQYRTSNVVTGLPRTIDVLGFTGSCCALTSKMRTALQWAVNNYNRINTNLNFTLSFGSTNWQSFDMVVYNNGAAGGGGSAGFPSGGNPFQLIQINAGTDAFSTNVNEHVITHEMGHCLGLRHSDYMNRSFSCGTGGNEGSGGIGAIGIPGTPNSGQNNSSGIDAESIMLACFNSNVDGEFSAFDVVALEFLY